MIDQSKDVTIYCRDINGCQQKKSPSVGQIKTQELVGGAERRQPILGFYVLHLATAIETNKADQ